MSEESLSAMEQLPRVISVEQVAEWLGVSEDVVRRACRSGRLPAVQLGREYRIDPNVILEMLRKGSLSPDDEEGGETLDSKGDA